jgi:MinD-like ATPase involved in chromosome partitioning or flagellar assembly
VRTTKAEHAASPTVEDIAGDDWIRWLLVFSSARRRDVEATFESVRRWVRERPGLEIGVTIHGVRQIAEAREAFDELARSCDERLGLPLASYGLLVDDLEVYRSIAAGRPIGESQPTVPAARALTDVARLLYEDARSRVLG